MTHNQCSPATEYALTRRDRAQMLWSILKSYMLDECSLECAAIGNADEKNLINLIFNSLPEVGGVAQTERHYSEAQVAEAVEKVISGMLDRGEITRGPSVSSTNCGGGK